MVGNVFEWTEDCAHNNYDGAPTDGSAGGERRFHQSHPAQRFLVQSSDFLHSANRRRFATVARFNKLGFRVGRMLVTP